MAHGNNQKVTIKFIQLFPRQNQGCGVGSPVIRLRLLEISIIRLQLRLRTDSDLQLY